jgi:hypothetical protein
MSAVPITPEPLNRAATGGVIAFTPRGEAALDQLATVISARCSTTPEGIAKVLDQVMHADMTELVDALTAIASESEQRATPDLSAEQRATRVAALDPAGGDGGLPAHGDRAPRTPRGPLGGTDPSIDPALPGLDEALAATTQPRQPINRLQRAGSPDAAGLLPREGRRR